MGCPFCSKAPEEHEMRRGYICWTWVCPNALPGWRGVFYDNELKDHPQPPQPQYRPEDFA